MVGKRVVERNRHTLLLGNHGDHSLGQVEVVVVQSSDHSSLVEPWLDAHAPWLQEFFKFKISNLLDIFILQICQYKMMSVLERCLY